MHKNLVLSIKNLSYSYDNKTNVLEDISLEVIQGDFLAIIGANGGGKSTLLSLIVGLLEIQTGSISIAKDINIGYVPQNTNINTNFPINVIDVVLMGHKEKQNKHFFNLFGYSYEEKQCALNSLAKVGMEKFAYTKIGSLSGGQRQRVMIARALSAHPDILILDEPTSSIDIDGQKQIFELLKMLNQTITIIVVSHDISLVLQYASKVVHISKKLTTHNDFLLNNNIKPKHSNQHFCEIELIEMLSNKESK